jgi:hypothetical protein
VVVVICSKVTTLIHLLPGVVGLNFFIPTASYFKELNYFTTEKSIFAFASFKVT